jgi:hypothetical protein
VPAARAGVRRDHQRRRERLAHLWGV